MPASAGLIREAGGLGDVIRIGSVGAALKRRGIDHVVAYGLEQYRTTFERLEGIDEFRPIYLQLSNRRSRQSAWHHAPYLVDLVDRKHDRIVDLFCPGFNYEVSVAGKVTLDRTECFIKAAGVELEPDEDIRPRWIISDEDRRAVDGVFRGTRPMVGLARTATDPSRTLPVSAAMELIERLVDAGYDVGVIDLDWYLPTFRSDHVRHIVRMAIPCVAAVIERLECLVAVDSGLLHLAGALDVPTVGLFGPTDPEVMLKHYPRAVGVTGYGWSGPLYSPCQQPCWYRPDRGFDSNVCRNNGCYWVHRLSMTEVVREVKRFAHRDRRPHGQDPPPDGDERADGQPGLLRTAAGPADGRER